MKKGRCPAIHTIYCMEGGYDFKCQKEIGHDGPHFTADKKQKMRVEFEKSEFSCGNCEYHDCEDWVSAFWERYDSNLPPDNLWKEMASNAIHTCEINDREFRVKYSSKKPYPNWCPAMKEGLPWKKK